MRKVVVTMSDIQRYKVLTEVIEKKLTAGEASGLLSLSYRHTLRLKHKVKDEGLEGLLRKPLLYPPNKKITEQVTKEIIKLRRELYYDFNIMHLKDKLEENHNIRLCYESLRKILIKTQEHSPRKKKVIHRQRRRMPKAGMLVQMDSSEHRWLEHISEKWWLIAMIDDATNEVPYARFFPNDTLFANMHVIRRFLELKGIFMSLYVDKASHFKTTRHGGLHYTVPEEQEDTQIQRALEELGITLIPANSPQAKGRIEVTFRLFQDRLIKEMRLAGVKNYDEANQFLQETFLPWYNVRYTHEAEYVYMPLLKEHNLDLIFCMKHVRTVRRDNTISFHGQIFQIPSSPVKLSFAKTKVELCLLEDRRIFVLYKGEIIAESLLSQDSKTMRKQQKIDELLYKRQYILAKIPSVKSTAQKTLYIPSANHPWRRAISKDIKSNQIRKKCRVERKAEKEIEKIFGGPVTFVQ